MQAKCLSLFVRIMHVNISQKYLKLIKHGEDCQSKKESFVWPGSVLIVFIHYLGVEIIIWISVLGLNDKRESRK